MSFFGRMLLVCMLVCASVYADMRIFVCWYAHLSILGYAGMRIVALKNTTKNEYGCWF